MGRRWRLHHPELPTEPDAELELEPDEAHHAHRVLRLRVDDAVTVFDGCGGEWSARLMRCDAKGVRLRLERPVTGQEVDPELEVRLFQGLCRPERMEWVLQKGTEIGLAAVHPWASVRAEGRGVGPERLRRWERIVLQACKQSGRRRAPRVELRHGPLEAPPEGVVGLVLDPRPGTPPLRTRLGGEAPASVWVAAGPESGLAEEELLGLERSGWKRAGLGPRTLRSESAGLVAATLVLHFWGDLG